MTRLIGAVYIFGAALVIILTAAAISGAQLILFPNAMLPMELHELAEIWLALGFFPMAAVSILLYRLKRRRIIFAPAAVCLAFLISGLTEVMICLMKF